MAINYLSPINFNNQELRGVVIQKLAVAPSSPSVGQIYYNTADETIYMCTDDVTPTWVSLGGDITEVVAGDGLTGGGDTGSVTLNVVGGGGITVNADNIEAKVSLGLEIDTFGSISMVQGFDGLDFNGLGALSAKVDNTSIEIDGSNNLSLKSTAVTAGSYGSATEIPTFTVDADGRLTAASTAIISTSFDISGDTGTDTVNTGETITFTGGTNITTAVTDNQVTVNLDDNVTLAGDLVVQGNFTVSGAVQTKISETVLIEDNIITLNSNETGSPTEDSGIEVERGTGTNVSLIWDESSNRWRFTNNGTTFYNIPEPSEYNFYNFTISEDSGVNQQIIDAQGGVDFLAGSGLDVAVSATGEGGAVTYTHSDTSSVSDVDNSGLTVIQDLTFDGFGHVQTVGSQDITGDVDARIVAREFKASIGDGATTAYTVTHNLGTRDVIVQLFDNSTYDTVYADVERTTTNTVDITFGSAPALNDIRVLITKIG